MGVKATGEDWKFILTALLGQLNGLRTTALFIKEADPELGYVLDSGLMNLDGFERTFRYYAELKGHKLQ